MKQQEMTTEQKRARHAVRKLRNKIEDLHNEYLELQKLYADAFGEPELRDAIQTYMDMLGVEIGKYQSEFGLGLTMCFPSMQLELIHKYMEIHEDPGLSEEEIRRLNHYHK